MHVLSGVLDGLFPITCPACANPDGVSASGGLCPGCVGQIPRHVWPVRAAVPAIDATFCLLPYEGLGGTLVRAGKYGQREALLQFLAARGGRGLIDRIPAVQAVVDVPSPWARVVARGFSAPAMLATSCARALCVPSLRGLSRSAAPKQAGRSRGERWDNAQGGVRWRGDRLPGPSVLLVDDVVTTGATACACAQVLRDEGAETVYLLVLASALH